jgi:hypothetical protein
LPFRANTGVFNLRFRAELASSNLPFRAKSAVLSLTFRDVRVMLLHEKTCYRKADAAIAYTEMKDLR